MGGGKDKVANSARASHVRFADDVAKDHESYSALCHAVQTLAHAAQVVALQAQSIQKCQPTTAQACSLHQKANELAGIIRSLEDTVTVLDGSAERARIAQLVSLGRRRSNRNLRASRIQGSILYSNCQIRGIVRKALSTSMNDESIVWKIADECHKQFVDGSLRLEEREGDRQSWKTFWTRAKYLAGPTLFRQPTNILAANYSSDIPRYLFRTFDSFSAGINNPEVIASARTMGENSRVDILTLDEYRSTIQLYEHLTKPCFSEEIPDDNSDNLVSWTSSMLFAIQYAIWRMRERNSSPSDVWICAVDTSKFPKRQFVPSFWLLKKHYSSAMKLDPRIRKFYESCLRNEELYNDEYLSQGAVYLEDRSCVVSLEQLIQKGLYHLYPEFEVHSDQDKLSRRVRKLRQKWSGFSRTPSWEVQVAMDLARKCFGDFGPLDMAIALLSFKYRQIWCTGDEPVGAYPAALGVLPPYWADKPEELRRYWMSTEALKAHQHINLDPHRRSDLKLLYAIYRPCAS